MFNPKFYEELKKRIKNYNDRALIWDVLGDATLDAIKGVSRFENECSGFSPRTYEKDITYNSLRCLENLDANATLSDYVRMDAAKELEQRYELRKGGAPEPIPDSKSMIKRKEDERYYYELAHGKPIDLVEMFNGKKSNECRLESKNEKDGLKTSDFYPFSR